MRGGNPHRPQTTRRTGPRQELTVGSRKRKFLVGRASTLLGKGSTWELGRHGHAAAGGAPVPRDIHTRPRSLGQGAGPTTHRPQGEGESGTPKAGPADLPSPLSGCLLRQVAPDHRGTSSARATRGNPIRGSSGASSRPTLRPGKRGRSHRRRGVLAEWRQNTRGLLEHAVFFPDGTTGIVRAGPCSKCGTEFQATDLRRVRCDRCRARHR